VDWPVDWLARRDYHGVEEPKKERLGALSVWVRS